MRKKSNVVTDAIDGAPKTKVSSWRQKVLATGRL